MSIGSFRGGIRRKRSRALAVGLRPGRPPFSVSLEPTRTVRQYWKGIVSYFDGRITQGAIEAINGIIQLAKRRARGFRNFLYLWTIASLNTSRFDIDLSGLWLT